MRACQMPVVSLILVPSESKAAAGRLAERVLGGFAKIYGRGGKSK